MYIQGLVLQFQAFLGILEHIPHGQGGLLYFMKSVINVYTPNSEPSKEFERDKAKKNICAISSMIFCPSDGAQVHERVEPLYFAFHCYLPPAAALQRFWEEFLSLVLKKQQIAHMLLPLILIMIFPKISKREYLGTVCQIASCLFFQCFKC